MTYRKEVMLCLFPTDMALTTNWATRISKPDQRQMFILLQTLLIHLFSIVTFYHKMKRIKTNAYYLKTIYQNHINIFKTTEPHAGASSKF